MSDSAQFNLNYYLTQPVGNSGDLPVVKLRVSRSDGPPKTLSLFLPTSGGTRYIVRILEYPLQMSVLDRVKETPLDCRAIRLADLRHLIWWRKSDYKARLEVPGLFSITPLLATDGREGRKLKKGLSILRKFGFAVSSMNFQCTPGLFDEWPPSGVTTSLPISRRKDDARRPSFAVVLHLYYRDLWPEFAWCLSRLTMSFKLIMTVNEHDAAFDREVHRVFPDAEIHVMENRGRDVGPFIELLRQGHLDRFDVICKLHGKRSAVSGPRALLGHIWRRANLIDLVGSDEKVEYILQRFQADHDIGMIGSSRFHFPSKYFHEEGMWGENRNVVIDLIGQLGANPEGCRAEYYAGTMFWIGRKPLAVLKQLGLGLSDFEAENGAIDGTLAHAMERLFGMIPSVTAQKLEDAPVIYDPPDLFPPNPEGSSAP